MLQSQSKSLEEQLETLSSKLVKQTRESSSASLSQQQQLESAQAEVSSLREEKQAAAARLTAVQEKLAQARQELLDTKTEMADIEQHSQREIANLNKLVALHKEVAADSQTKVDDLNSSLASLRTLLRDAQAETETVRQERTHELDELRKTVSSLEEQNAALRVEVSNANDLLKQSTATQDDPASVLSPSAAVASAALKEGMSLTEMWTELINTRKALQAERQEVTRLEEFLQQILQDVEAKAPLFQRQKAELEQSELSKRQLTASLEECHREYEQLETAWRKEQARATRLQSVNGRLEETISDLSAQIQQLLARITELSGGSVTSDAVAPGDAAQQSMDALNQDMVAIDSIKTLQEQNVKLLRRVRELADHNTQEAERARAAANDEVQGQLQAALDQLKDLKGARERHQQTVNALTKQRDMFKALYTEACLAAGKNPESTTRLIMSPSAATAPSGSSGDHAGAPATPHGSATGVVASTPTSASASASTAGGLTSPQPRASAPRETAGERDNGQLLRELQSDFESYRHERQETDRMLREELDKARTQASEARMLNARLTAHNEHLSSRYKDLEESVNSLREENRRLIDKSTQSAKLLVEVQTKLQNAEARTAESIEELQLIKVRALLLENGGGATSVCVCVRVCVCVFVRVFVCVCVWAWVLHFILIVAWLAFFVQVKNDSMRERVALLEASEEHLRQENQQLLSDRKSQNTLLKRCAIHVLCDENGLVFLCFALVQCHGYLHLMHCLLVCFSMQMLEQEMKRSEEELKRRYARCFLLNASCTLVPLTASLLHSFTHSAQTLFLWGSGDTSWRKEA